MEKMRQAMLSSATEAGGADFGQQIINSLNVPDALTVQTALASATQEEIEKQVTETKGHMQAVWDKNKIVLKFDAQPSAATIAALKALGMTVLGPDGKPILGGDSVTGGVQVPNRNPDNRSAQSARGAAAKTTGGVQVPNRTPDNRSAQSARGAAAKTIGGSFWDRFGGGNKGSGVTYDSVTRQIKEDVKSLPAFSGWTANENRIGLPVFYQQKIGELQANPSSGARIDLVNKMFEVGHRFPYFAQGDVVNRPTVGVFGEAGPEVIVPLSKPKRMIQLLSKALTMTGHLTGMLPKFAEGAIVGGKGGGMPKFADGAIFGGGMPSPVPMGNQAQASSDRDTMSALLDELRMMRQASAYNETNNYNIHGQSDPHGTALATMAERKADRFRSAKPRRF
mgnify:CR=1 FL=1